ncbi:hypothetical protein RD792_007411 [Penstemon davidsonii]|uniref:Protein kinase domain-containing protein n=1 Tax=Penstemon davidsonii TaxID=160366 RepID=A0ABR0D744_9LAMI|nr:hypothetical protein RD792_007411 [Penstemon davidsonii]
MEWTRGPIIGRGSTASVSLSTTTNGDLIAVKSTELSSSPPLLQTEQFLISQLSSPYIVKCLGSDITYEKNKQMYNLFLEYVPGGTLSDLIKKQGSSLNENAIQFYTHQILQGLNYLHLNGIVHCDIKGQNLLIGKDGLKIADFGCAKLAESKSEFAGTPAYMAPEVARGEEQSFPADIWAMGCTIIEMATGTNPWSEMKDPVSALYRIGYSGEVPEIPRCFSGNAEDFLSKCLMWDPKERWTAGELLRHPFLSIVGKCCLEVKEFTRKLSPTTVMDRGFWDDLEASDSSRNPTVVIASCSDSPAGRIRGLFGDNFSMDLEFPEWTEDEDWVTVRVYECDYIYTYEISCFDPRNDEFKNFSKPACIDIGSRFPLTDLGGQLCLYRNTYDFTMDDERVW